MIVLYRRQSENRDLSVALHRGNGAVGYYKDGLLQTLIDARGRNLASHVETAVHYICDQGAKRALVLGHGGGVASTLLYRRGIEVTSVDIDPTVAGLGQVFFGAPPTLPVVTADAAEFVSAAAEATFDAIFVDFQDAEIPPAAYLKERFWSDVRRVLSSDGQVLINVTDYLWDSPTWPKVLKAVRAAGLAPASTPAVSETGNRVVVAKRSS